MYYELDGWKITPRSNYESQIQDLNKVLDLGRDYGEAKQNAAYNFGLQNVTIIRRSGSKYERSY